MRLRAWDIDDSSFRVRWNKWLAYQYHSMNVIKKLELRNEYTETLHTLEHIYITDSTHGVEPNGDIFMECHWVKAPKR